MNQSIVEATEAAPILCQISHQVIFHPEIPAFPPHILAYWTGCPTLLARASATYAAYTLTDTAAPDTDTQATIGSSKRNSKCARPRITSGPDVDVTLMDSYGESDGNAEYVKSPKNLRTRSANMPELGGCIRELKQMHKVAEEDIDVISQPMALFTLPDDLNPTELANAKTTPSKNNQDNGSSTPLGTQPSFPNSPLTDIFVAS